jgi:hypothetical protein
MRCIFGGHNTPSDADVYGLENFSRREMNGGLISIRKTLKKFWEVRKFACGNRGY